MLVGTTRLPEINSINNIAEDMNTKTVAKTYQVRSWTIYRGNVSCRCNKLRSDPANRNDKHEDSQCRNMNHFSTRSEKINYHVKLRISTRKKYLVPAHSSKTYGRRRVLAQLILIPGARWRWWSDSRPGWHPERYPQIQIRTQNMLDCSRHTFWPRVKSVVVQ